MVENSDSLHEISWQYVDASEGIGDLLLLLVYFRFHVSD